MGIPHGSAVKNLPAVQETRGSMPGLGKSLGEGNGNLLQYSCLGNPMDRGTWWPIVRGGCKSVGHNLETKQQLWEPDSEVQGVAWLVTSMGKVRGLRRLEEVSRCLPTEPGSPREGCGPRTWGCRREKCFSALGWWWQWAALRRSPQPAWRPMA